MARAKAAQTVQQLRASDGRVPGRRGRATREKLLSCTAQLLEKNSYRDLKVIDIARCAGTSPATFYQYFNDVEAVRSQILDKPGVVRDPGFFGSQVKDKDVSVVLRMYHLNGLGLWDSAKAEEKAEVQAAVPAAAKEIAR